MAKPILVVEDSASMRAVVRQVLEGAGHAVEEAADAETGLDRLLEGRFKLILCDLNMPGIDGAEFVRRLRNDALFKDHRFTPVAIMTTEREGGRKDAARDAGASAWITKPLQPEILVEVVARLCGD